MKKYLIAASLLLSVSVFAQKDELKALKKLTSKDEMPNIQEFKKLLDAAEAKLESADEEQKADFYYYKGQFAALQMMTNPATAQKNLDIAIESLNKVIEIEKGLRKQPRTEEIRQQVYPELRAALVNQASALGKQQKYKEAYPLYEKVYRISPKDTVYLYNAAAYAVNSQQYPQALEYYKELQRIGFTGSVLNYTAKNLATGEVEYFGDKKVRDLYVANKTHAEPSIYREESKKGEIIKNIALIYINQGEKEKGMAAIAEAKKANPNDTSLLMAEAQIYLEAKDYENYKKAVTQVLNQGSQDPNLYFNLGVTSAKSGQKEEAALYYKKAIELDPKYMAAYQNLGILQLDGEDAIVKEMNSLGTSSKEMKRYDELKKKRDDMYKQAVVYLEKAHEIKPDDENIKSILGTLYQGLEMMDKYKALKAE
ncbi:tetratricopeptide repeat protein [Flavobacterium salilacus subsp. salilacus]|uniref:tetratricopeptide repeat protein n=1 Tax=Flavobacterium TaxID=237 RepID=UPI0010751800|nr:MULTISPECIES: tetratricopeptide repeat protein [Flavobacterium]KAF2519221.1 tetratricopeptide repeat protein [Flavobacterium salilacus subsp. salilacus]MBE1613401.1 tetratricopeptide repeat protein [Flavobacterium sp. SaA2.13]